MEVTIQRDTFTDNSTTGELFIDGGLVCYTLEPRADRSQGKPYCIPAGRYRIAILWSNRFQMNTPHVMDVPGFTEVEWHPGNFPSDTEACLLPGTSRSVDMVASSRSAFKLLMEKLQGQDSIYATYIGGPTE